jgi:hypothetical protein
MILTLPTGNRSLKTYKAAGEVIVAEARSMVAYFDNSKGTGEPLSGMRRGNLIKGRNTSWRTDQVQKGFKVKVGVRRKQRALRELQPHYRWRGNPYRAGGLWK